MSRGPGRRQQRVDDAVERVHDHGHESEDMTIGLEVDAPAHVSG